MATWIDFKELRQKLDFTEILKHYGVELKLKAGGHQHQGFCPLPAHSGKGQSPSFSANLEKGIFQCFGCGAKGNALEFAARMENLNPGNPAEFRKAALIVKERFFPEETKRPERKEAKAAAEPMRKPETTPEPTPTPAEAPEPKTAAVRVINAPLDFELKGLDATHPYLASRGILPAAVAQFGIGYCNRGLMAGRIAIPLHRQDGKLVGYAGRLVDDKAINEEHPKYKFPSKREHAGVLYEFHKSTFLYNGYRTQRPSEDLVVVEGFTAVWWLWQNNYDNVVALMGSSCSDQQARLIVESVTLAGHVWIFPDGDEAGGRCAESALAKIAPHRFTRWVKLTDGKQPTDCTGEQLATLLSTGGVE